MNMKLDNSANNSYDSKSLPKMELPFPSAFGPCMVVVPEAYAGLVQERWAVFVHEVEQLLRYLHGLSVANDGGSGGGVCGHWPLHGWCRVLLLGLH